MSNREREIPRDRHQEVRTKKKAEKLAGRETDDKQTKKHTETERGTGVGEREKRTNERTDWENIILQRKPFEDEYSQMQE